MDVSPRAHCTAISSEYISANFDFYHSIGICLAYQCQLNHIIRHYLFVGSETDIQIMPLTATTKTWYLISRIRQISGEFNNNSNLFADAEQSVCNAINPKTMHHVTVNNWTVFMKYSQVAHQFVVQFGSDPNSRWLMLANLIWKVIEFQILEIDIQSGSVEFWHFATIETYAECIQANARRISRVSAGLSCIV